MKHSNLFLIACLYCRLQVIVSVFTPVVQVSQGKLRGLRSLSGQNRYYGIPYAVSERFKPPREPPIWEGTFNAINRFGSCAQSVSFLTLGTEDCLKLDVYSPEDAEPQLPVLVFIHGGSYYYGSKSHYDPEFLVLKNVVVVIINYRVGVLGFLCINGVANLGLKDQTAALKWIKKNIAAFGGDPENVTISGQSAGSTAASMHLLAKSSRGLFHKAFLISGTAIAPWAFNSVPLTPAIVDANKIGPARTEKEIFDIFANAPLQKLLDATHGTTINSRNFNYSPCVDSNFSDPFFHDTPYNIIKSGNFEKVPMIIGHTNVEGMLFYGLNDGKSFQSWNDDFLSRLPSVFSWCPMAVRLKIAKKLRQYYFGFNTIDNNAIRSVVNYYSDWLIYATTNAFSNLMARYSKRNIYNYLFSYDGGRNYVKFLFGKRTGMAGASHSDDVFYIFKPMGLSVPLWKEDSLLIDKWTTMITNFMKYGDPTPKKSEILPLRWPPITVNTSETLVVDHQLSVIELPNRFKGNFFRNLLCKHGQKGYVPCDGPQKCSMEEPEDFLVI